MEGVCMRKKLGLRLLELIIRKDVSQFLKEIGNREEDTPAEMFYEQKTRSFVFYAYRLQNKRLRYLGTYKNHFGKNVLDLAQIFLGLAHSDQTYGHFYCQNFQTKNPGCSDV